MNRYILLFAMIGLVLIASLVGCSTPTPKIIVVTATPEGQAVPSPLTVAPTVARPTTAPATTVPTAARPAATSTSVPTPIPTVGTLTPLNTPPPDVVAVLTDTSGTVVNFKTFEVSVGTGDFAYPPVSSSKVFPLRQDAAMTFIALDKMSEYHIVFGTATVVLVNGDRIAGNLLDTFSSQFSFSGESNLGKLSIPAEKVKTIKFNLEQVKRSLQGKPAIQATSDWPNQYTLRAEMTLATGNALVLRNTAFVSRYGGCNEMYLPCKPYSGVSLASSIPIKFGEYATTLDLARVESMGVKSPTEPLNMSIRLRGGEERDATLDNTYRNYALAIMGMTDNGLIHVPLAAIKSVTFK